MMLLQSLCCGLRLRRAMVCAVLIAMIFSFASPHTAYAADEQAAAAEAPSPEDIRAKQAAEEVFQGNEFWWKRTEQLGSLSISDRFFKWIYDYLIKPVFDFIRWLFGSISMPSTGDWSGGIPFMWIFVAALAAYAVWRLVRTFLGWKPQQAPAPQQSIAVETLPDAMRLLDDAQQALARKDARGALRWAFLALLAWLQDAGRLRYDPSRSNREYQRDLSAWPDLLAAFRFAADPFERCWYGGREIDAAQVASVIESCRRQILQSGAAS